MCVGVCVGGVWRGYLFHGFMEWGFMCGCWFQGLVWTALPGTAFLLDRPKFRAFFRSPAAKFVLFFPLWVS